MYPCLVGLAEEGEGADAGGGKQLDGEDGIDLAYELVADIDSGFGDGATKLGGVSVKAVLTAQGGAGALTLKSSGRLSSLLRGAPNRP